MTNRTSLAIVTLALASAGCFGVYGEAETSIGGSVVLDQALEVAPFYSPIMDQALIDSRLLSSSPLVAFEPPPHAEGIVAGSSAPIGRLGELQVGRWTAIDDTLGVVDCVGFTRSDAGSGSECTERGPGSQPAPTIHYEVSCSSTGPPHWFIFTVDERVDALHLVVEADVAVVGDDPRDTGLVAAEAIGDVTAATAQTTTGQVWVVDIAMDCPPSVEEAGL
jgi:hypothetical protein